MKPMRIAWWIWVLLIVACIVAPMASSQQRAQINIPCVDGICYVPEQLLEHLIEQVRKCKAVKS
jgi:hypothetical protein